MDRSERFYLIERLLTGGHCVTSATLMSELGVSRATLMRDLGYMRDRLGAPIRYDGDAGGYRLERKPGERSTLPGLWFNASEIQALLAMLELLRNVEPGILASHVVPLRRRLESLLSEGGFDPATVLRRVRLVPLGKRRAAGPFFEVAASALLSRRRLRVTHHNRHTDERHVRELSPLRLTYYRDNWYLDAWCHLREDLRSFSVDAFATAVVLPESALEVPDAQIEERFDSGYGIFSHPTASLQWARLKFSPYRARWAATEQWHPEQRITWTSEGALLLDVPFHDLTELVWDVLKQGGECEALAPAVLRQAVADEVRRVSAIYGDGRSAPAGRAPES